LEEDIGFDKAQGSFRTLISQDEESCFTGFRKAKNDQAPDDLEISRWDFRSPPAIKPTVFLHALTVSRDSFSARLILTPRFAHALVRPRTTSCFVQV